MLENRFNIVSVVRLRRHVYAGLCIVTESLSWGESHNPIVPSGEIELRSPLLDTWDYITLTLPSLSLLLLQYCRYFVY